MPPDPYDDISRRLEKIENSVDDIKERILSMNLCESPNSCVYQKELIQQHYEWLMATDRRIVALEKRISWIAGVGVVIAVVIPSIFATLRLVL